MPSYGGTPVEIWGKEYFRPEVVDRELALAEDLGFVCLAEGAERKEQVECLSKFGCDLIQGYYYCRPISIREFENIYLPSERP